MAENTSDLIRSWCSLRFQLFCYTCRRKKFSSEVVYEKPTKNT